MAGTDLQEPHAEDVNEATYELAAGPDLDALIAGRVMGWSRREDYYYTGPPGPKAFTHVGQCSVQDFRPSTDMAMAWRVVEKLAARQLYLILSTTPAGSVGVTFARAHVSQGGAVAASAPLAICQAALQVVVRETPRD